jgi:hypothetical protein
VNGDRNATAQIVSIQTKATALREAVATLDGNIAWRTNELEQLQVVEERAAVIAQLKATANEANRTLEELRTAHREGLEEIARIGQRLSDLYAKHQAARRRFAFTGNKIAPRLHMGNAQGDSAVDALLEELEGDTDLTGIRVNLAGGMGMAFDGHTTVDIGPGEPALQDAMILAQERRQQAAASQPPSPFRAAGLG